MQIGAPFTDEQKTILRELYFTRPGFRNSRFLKQWDFTRKSLDDEIRSLRKEGIRWRGNIEELETIRKSWGPQLGAFTRYAIPEDELVVQLLITFARQTFREGNNEGLEMMREAKTKADELVAQAQTPAEMLRARRLQRAAAVSQGAMRYSLYKEEHGITPPTSWLEEQASIAKRSLGAAATPPGMFIPRTPLAWHETRTGVHAAVAASKGDLDTAKRLIRKSVTEAFARARKAQTPKHQAWEMQTAYEAFQFFNRLHEDPQAAVVYAQELLRSPQSPIPA